MPLVSENYITIIHVIIFRTISGGINAGCFEYATTAMNRKMRSDLFRSILYQEIAFFDEVKTGNYIFTVFI
jgi:ABC-type bacteriocin/lantibiotic exporter with double-glycine peptidase domain